MRSHRCEPSVLSPLKNFCFFRKLSCTLQVCSFFPWFLVMYLYQESSYFICVWKHSHECVISGLLILSSLLIKGSVSHWGNFRYYQAGNLFPNKNSCLWNHVNPEVMSKSWPVCVRILWSLGENWDSWACSIPSSGSSSIDLAKSLTLLISQIPNLPFILCMFSFHNFDTSAAWSSLWAQYLKIKGDSASNGQTYFKKQRNSVENFCCISCILCMALIYLRA